MRKKREFSYEVQQLETPSMVETFDMKRKIIELLIKEYITRPERPGK